MVEKTHPTRSLAKQPTLEMAKHRLSSRPPETGGGESPTSFEGRMEAGIEAAGETVQTNLSKPMGKTQLFFQTFKGSLRDDDVSPTSDKLWWMDLFFSVDPQENLPLEYGTIRINT